MDVIDPDTNRMPELIRKDRRRGIWRWTKRILVVLALHVIVITIGFAIDWKLTRNAGQKKVDAITAKLDAEDPGWRFEDIGAEHNAKVPPPESNSAMKAVEIVKGFPKLEGPTTPDVQSVRAKIDKDRLPNELPDAEAYDELEMRFAPYERGIAELAAWSASAPRGRLKIEYLGGSPMDIRLENTQHLRMASFALSWQAIRYSRRGKTAQSLATAMAGLHLVRSIDYEPLLITYLIRIAGGILPMNSVEQTLAWNADADDKSLAALQELAWKESTNVSIKPSIRCERALMQHLFELIDRGEITVDDKKPQGFDLGTQIFRQYIPANIAFVHEQCDEFLSILDLPSNQKATAIQRWTFPPRTRENLLGHLLIPAMNKVALAELRYQAKCLCTAAGIACERRRLKHGKWPATLDDLAEFGIDPKALIDPFDGQPMRYRIVEDGAVVYSVGTNGVDDDGDVVRREGTPDDVGFRLWNADKRKVPMPEKPKPVEGTDDGPPP